MRTGHAETDTMATGANGNSRPGEWLGDYLTTRIGDYADTGKPLFALVDSHSFYVIGYFEETKLRHIREGAPAQITLYSDNKTLRGHVSSIGRAIYDQSVESDSSLIPDVNLTSPGFVSPTRSRPLCAG